MTDPGTGPTPAAQRLGEQYVETLALVEQCARAVEAGLWAELDDKAGALSEAADELAALASAATREEVAVTPGWVLATALDQDPSDTGLLGILHPDART